MGKMSKRRRSLKTKIVILMSIILLTVCTGLGLTAYRNIYSSLKGNIGEMLPKLAIEAAKVVESRILSRLNYLDDIASNELIISNVSNQSINTDVMSILNRETQRHNFRKILLSDTRGNAVYNDGKRENVSGKTFFQEALKGERYVSAPELSVENDGIEMFFSVPVKSGNNIIGVISAVVDGYELCDLIEDITVGQTGNVFIVARDGRTIAHSNKEVLINLINSVSRNVDGVSSATRKVDAEEVDAVSSATMQKSINEEAGYKNYVDIQRRMAAGETGFGEYEFQNVIMYLGFSPINLSGWSVAVQVEKAELMAGLSLLQRDTGLASLIFLIISLLVVYLFTRRITRHLEKLKYYTTLLGDYDLTFEISKKLLDQNDEIGEMSRNFKLFVDSVHAMIKKIADESKKLYTLVDTTHGNIAALTNALEEASSSVQEVSAGMEETASSTEEITATTFSIENAVESVASKAQEGAQSAADISKKAIYLKERSMELQDDADRTRLSIRKIVDEALEKARNVERIKSLSEVILQISAQTNMLALNAAIESSRAGESGKGFSVVAEEIRKLAESSKQTVKDIQDTLRAIFDAVDNLTDSSRQTLEYIETKVMDSYKGAVLVGDNYRKDAESISNWAEELNAVSQELLASVKVISEGINEIARATAAGSEGTSYITEKIIDIKERADEIKSETDDVKISVDQLHEMIQKFKV